MVSRDDSVDVWSVENSAVQLDPSHKSSSSTLKYFIASKPSIDPQLTSIPNPWNGNNSC